MSDPYGIPDSMFGPVPEEFYAAVGRVVMVSAILELRLLDLLVVLAERSQGDYAGEMGSRLISLCRQQLGLLHELA